MKRVLSVLLAVCIIFSLSIGVFAATINISADKSKISAGDEVTVTLTAKEAMENYFSFEYRLYFDDTKFDLKVNDKGVSIGQTNTYVTVSKKFTDSKGSFYKISALNPTGGDISYTAGEYLANLIFTAKGDIASTADAKFELTIVESNRLDDSTGIPVPAGDTAGPAVTVTVTPAAQTSKYSVAASTTTPSTTVGSNATVSLGVTNAATSNTYNSYYFEVSYDNTVLEYVSNNAGAEATAANGKLTIAGYGADRTAPVVLTFKGLKVGSSDVTITKANIDAAENAHVQNAPAAEIATAAVTINVTAASYNVTLDKALFTGADTVTGGTDYTFSANDTEHYDYSNVTATMGGETVDVIDNGNGSYTIQNVSGDLNITGSRTGKQYDVTVTGNAASKVTAASKATYNTAYTFTVTKTAGYTYTLTAKNADGEITLSENNGTYTIAADKVTSDITITVNKTANRTVEVSEYVKANNTQFWLVTVKGTVADGNVLTYNNAPMLWSAKYDAYAYLVIDTTGKTEAQMKIAAEAAIGEAAGEKTSINYNGDVNATGTVDVNDAQLVYNMYNAKYTSFDNCSMEKFLRADVNYDKTLDVKDAAAIVSIILSK